MVAARCLMLKPPLTVLMTVLMFCFVLLQLGCAPRLILLTRHAEKADESDDALLSTIGQEHAERLAQLLSTQRVTAIFVSERQRTQQTAQPLAQKQGVTPVILPAAQRAELRRRLMALPKRDVALVVGHSNTLPNILADLGVPSEQKPRSVEYGDLFIVIHHFGQSPSLLRLHY